MSGNGYSDYFGQAVASEERGTENRNTSGQTNLAGTTNSSQTVATGTIGNGSIASRISELEISRGPGTQAGSQSTIPDIVFRASLVLQMDALVQDFRTEKISRSETLYQILKTLLEAGLEESDRRSTLEEYTSYVDIIASRQKESRTEAYRF